IWAKTPEVFRKTIFYAKNICCAGEGIMNQKERMLRRNPFAVGLQSIFFSSNKKRIFNTKPLQQVFYWSGLELEIFVLCCGFLIVDRNQRAWLIMADFFK